MLLTSTEYRPRMTLNILWCTEQPPTAKNDQVPEAYHTEVEEPCKPVSPNFNKQGSTLCSSLAGEQTELHKGITCVGHEEAVAELRPSIFKH